MSQTYAVPACACPVCKTVQMEATNLGTESELIPHPGMLVICTECCSFLRFDSHMQLQLFTQSEFELLDRAIRHRLMRIKEAIVSVKRSSQH